jgi:L,D-transpeptidase catalytic domain
MRMRFFAACTVLLTAFLAQPFSSFAQDSDAGELRTGGYVWHPELAPSGDMTMTIDLSRQRAYVRRDGVCIGISTVSTGKPGYETPTGEYSVMEKQRYHHSNRYDNAPMPWMQRLTEYGLALHGGHLPGYPASHGCIRLPHGFAAALFQESYVGMRVTITDHAPSADDTTTYGTSDPDPPPAGLRSCEPDATDDK